MRTGRKKCLGLVGGRKEFFALLNWKIYTDKCYLCMKEITSMSYSEKAINTCDRLAQVTCKYGSCIVHKSMVNILQFWQYFFLFLCLLDAFIHDNE